jgi:hypothetical protein
MRLILILLTFTLVSCAIKKTESHSATYKVSITLVKNEEILSTPKITVLENVTGTMSINNNDKDYSFNILVHKENGKLICSTKANIINNHKIINLPRISILIGQSGFVEKNGLKIIVKAKKA